MFLWSLSSTRPLASIIDVKMSWRTNKRYSVLFFSIIFFSILFYSILFYSILFYSIIFYSILFYSILFYSILFSSILFYSILRKKAIMAVLADGWQKGKAKKRCLIIVRWAARTTILQSVGPAFLPWLAHPVLPGSVYGQSKLCQVLDMFVNENTEHCIPDRSCVHVLIFWHDFSIQFTNTNVVFRLINRMGEDPDDQVQYLL